LSTSDALVASLDARTGIEQWIVTITSTSTPTVINSCISRDAGVATESSGSFVYVFGEFNGPTVQIGPAIVTNSQEGSYDVFIAKLTAAVGTVQWAFGFGGQNHDHASAIIGSSVASYSGIFLTGTVRAATQHVSSFVSGG
jgi:hypothetical protein